jgi:hypothetical protein
MLLQLGCDWLSDPAVRLAYCVEAAVNDHPRDGAATHASCDLEMPGSYVVILHPAGALGDEQLVSAGLPQSLLPEFRLLRESGNQPAIYVIAADPRVSGTGSGRSIRSSFTTYQMNFVQIDRLMVLAKATQPVTVDLGGPVERLVIDGIH